MEEHHYFYALLLPQSIKQYLYEKCEHMKGELPFKSWVHQEDYHITLAFLGNANEEQLEKADGNIKDALSNAEGFDLTLNQLGVFGLEDSPRIFWANTKESEALIEIRKLVYDSCEKVGFQLDPRPFKPHITLARNWLGENPFQLESLKHIINEDEKFIANQIVLYETHLNKTPKYVIKNIHTLHSNTD